MQKWDQGPTQLGTGILVTQAKSRLSFNTWRGCKCTEWDFAVYTSVRITIVGPKAWVITSFFKSSSHGWLLTVHSAAAFLEGPSSSVDPSSSEMDTNGDMLPTAEVMDSA